MNIPAKSFEEIMKEIMNADNTRLQITKPIKKKRPPKPKRVV